MYLSILDRAVRLALFVTLYVCWGSGCANSDDTSYTFDLDGVCVSPNILLINGVESEPAAGDLAAVGGWLFVLDGPGYYDLESSVLEGGGACLYRLIGGHRNLIGLSLAGPGAEVPSSLDVRALRCIRVDQWMESYASPFIDWSRCHLSVRKLGDPVGGGGLLPSGVTYLTLGRVPVGSVLDAVGSVLDALAAQRDLLYLDLTGALHCPDYYPDLSCLAAR